MITIPAQAISEVKIASISRNDPDIVRIDCHARVNQAILLFHPFFPFAIVSKLIIVE
jgi:hypothetical protein